jgi:hypothetical protein
MPELPQIVRERLEISKTLAGHPDPDVLTAFSERSLPAMECDVVLEHLARCGECREIVALALPETETIRKTAPFASPSTSLGWSWFTGSGLRWAVVAAGVIAVASVGIMELQHNKTAKSTLQSKLDSKPQFDSTSSVAAPSSAEKPSGSQSADQVSGAQNSTAQSLNEERAEQKLPINGRNIQSLQTLNAPTAQTQIHGATPSPRTDVLSGNKSSNRNFSSLQKLSPPNNANAWAFQTDQANETRDRNTTGALTLPDSLKSNAVPPAKPLDDASVAPSIYSGAAPVAARQAPARTAQQAEVSSATESLQVQAQAENSQLAVPSAPVQNQTQQTQTLQNQTLQNSTEEPLAKDQEISDLPKQQGRTSSGLQDLARADAPVGGGSTSRTRLPLWSVTSVGKLRRSFDGGKTWQDVNVGDSPMVATMFAKSADAQLAKATAKNKETASQREKKEEDTKKEDQDNREAKVYPAKNTIQDEHPVIFRAVSAMSTEVWAGGVAGVLYHSDDAGTHWTRVVPATTGTMLTSDIVTVEVPSPKYVKLATSNSEVWTTNDDGRTWQKQ